MSKEEFEQSWVEVNGKNAPLTTENIFKLYQHLKQLQTSPLLKEYAVKTRAALKTYGWHYTKCKAGKQSQTNEPCTCGFEEALSLPIPE